jgi:hypothetical protein
LVLALAPVEPDDEPPPEEPDEVSDDPPQPASAAAPPRIAVAASAAARLDVKVWVMSSSKSSFVDRKSSFVSEPAFVAQF